MTGPVHRRVNPLNVLGVREVENPPEHFSYILVNTDSSSIPHVRAWIYENLKHRFYISDTIFVDNEGSKKLERRTRIGFEDARELSFFLLACSHLKT